jgi:ATP-dependent RNA helicase RhlE
MLALVKSSQTYSGKATVKVAVPPIYLIHIMSFQSFQLNPSILKALQENNYQIPTPVQREAIPGILTGADILASAQTGTGKTAAFCLPILHKLSSSSTRGAIRALILTPTRELAIQVNDNIRKYGRNLAVKSVAIYGGVSQSEQVRNLRNGADIVVATPGRLMDLIQQRIITLNKVEMLVLDEADRMLDMGFINDIKRILKLTPPTRQNIFFSATVPDDIHALVTSMMRNPVRIRIANPTKKAQIEEGVFFVQRESKKELLKHIITENRMQTVLVFTRTKYGADKIVKDLNRSGITAEAFHGDKTQAARQRALTNFKKNSTRVLVATDIAARGIDILDLPFVINYELPESADTYTHRIGRTGRAGASGSAYSLCDSEERRRLNDINRISSKKIRVIEHPFS